MSTQSVALLGLGIMGGGMAENLLAKGFPLTVYNRNPARSAAFAGRARIAQTPAEAAKDADLIFAMVSDDDASRSLWLSDGGALTAARPGAVAIECSTISLTWGRELAAAAGKASVGFLDAPVLGSKLQAAEGTLRFLVGGQARDIELARPALAAMGSGIVELGEAGSGILVKLVNNFICGVEVAAFAEGLTVLEKSGLDIEKARALLLTGASASPLIKTIAGRIAAGDFAPNFFTSLLAKDLGYMAQEAAAVGVDLRSAAAARARFLDAVDAGFGEEDIAAVIKPLRA